MMDNLRWRRLRIGEAPDVSKVDFGNRFSTNNSWALATIIDFGDVCCGAKTRLAD
jgi:hypothetical protein